MSYPEIFRKRTLEFLNAGHSYKETHEVFQVSITTIQKWKRLQKETGGLKDKPPAPRPFKKIDPEKFKTYIKSHPDAYQTEMAAEFHCSRKAVQKALKRLNCTRKKSDALQGAGQEQG